jgi:methyltransferase (TIGR00027 family)
MHDKKFLLCLLLDILPSQFKLQVYMMSNPKPNFTAWFVMQGFLATLNHPHYADESAKARIMLYKSLEEAASRTRLISRLIYLLPYRLQYVIGQLVTNPTRMRHFLFRKKEVEKQTRQLLSDQGVTQVVVLGAGLDLLALQLAGEFPGVNFIEIDTAESQAFKTSVLKKYYPHLPNNLEYIEGDLQNPLDGILKPSRLHDPNALTLWIAEGFFMFMQEDDVRRILSEVAQLSPKGSYVLFTSIPSIKITSKLSYLLQTVYLKKEKSPFKWSIALDRVPVFADEIGYSVVMNLSCDMLHKNHMGHKFNGNQSFAENMHIAQRRNM